MAQLPWPQPTFAVVAAFSFAAAAAIRAAEQALDAVRLRRDERIEVLMAVFAGQGEFLPVVGGFGTVRSDDRRVVGRGGPEHVGRDDWSGDGVVGFAGGAVGSSARTPFARVSPNTTASVDSFRRSMGYILSKGDAVHRGTSVIGSGRSGNDEELAGIARIGES